MKNELTLIGLDIEGDWNVPLLENAADISAASLLFARSDSVVECPEGGSAGTDEEIALPHIDALFGRFDHVIACEVTKRSRPVYEFPAPRGRVGVIVGNELSGVPKTVLKKVDQVVSIPMFGRGMSSVNVAVAGAIILYALERDLGRKRLRPSTLSPRDVDVCIVGPSDPNELGSLLRSAWAFGWKRVFLDDPAGVWFSEDRATVLAGRAAARREVNPVVAVPREQLNLDEYDAVLVCDGTSEGTPLSRIELPTAGKLLVVYGEKPIPREFASTEPIFVDHTAPGTTPNFRHAGSILLSVLSNSLKRRARASERASGRASGGTRG